MTYTAPGSVNDTLVNAAGQRSNILKLIESNMLDNKLFVASIGDVTLAMTGHNDLDGNAGSSAVALPGSGADSPGGYLSAGLPAGVHRSGRARTRDE